jgi:adenylyltransferase/sulfurtransferase
MRLDDARIERYSRQLILAEIGPDGQGRLADARVAIVGDGQAAARVVSYLAAAGVGTLALTPALRAFVDPAQPDIRLEPLAPDPNVPFDAVLVDTSATGADDDAIPAPHARHTFWIADGRAAEIPPCHGCATATLGAPAPVPPTLGPLRDALLGTVVATEIVKALLSIGTPLRDHVLTYDPTIASLVTARVEPREYCPRCGRSETTS